MKLKEHFGYWLCCWAWLGGMIIAVILFGFFDGCKWGYQLMDWLDDHGFEMWIPYERLKLELEDKKLRKQPIVDG